MQIHVDPEQDFHVAINGVVTALSLDGLDDAYQADQITEETLIWQDGFADWMRLDTLLAILSEQEEAPSAPEPAAPPQAWSAQQPPPSVPEPAAAHQALYSVAVAPGQTQSMTLEALADAHRRGLVNEDTLVWQPGAPDWVPLAVIIASFATKQQAVPAPHVAPTQQSAPPSQAPPQQSASPTHTPVQHNMGRPSPVGAVAAHGAQAPRAVPSAHPAAHAPRAVPAALAAAPNTLAPTAANIGHRSPGVGLSASAHSALDDLDFPPLKSSGATWLKRSLVAAAALALGFVVFQGTRDSGGEMAAQPDGVATKSTPAAVPQVEKAEPTAWEKEQALLEKARLADEAAAKQANNPAADSFSARLTGDDEPKKVAPARPKSNWKPKPKQPSAPAPSPKGSQYDPMNGAL